MIFNSSIFLFVFLPALLVLYYGAAKVFAEPSGQGKRSTLGRGGRAALAILFVASLFFYSYGDSSLLVLSLSLLVNGVFGRVVVDTRNTSRGKWVYALALVFNLSLLGYYKYSGFVLANLVAATGWDLPIVHLSLPLGISFFTFTQIAFITDLYYRRIESFDMLQYGNIISFFPHLVAGPILFHHSMLPQFSAPRTYELRSRMLVVGLVLFSMGMFKKVVIADNLAPYANTIFDAVAAGGIPDIGQAWRGALLYSLQLYFDFSGYSDMAMGLGSMFGIKIPLNFFSPYKSMNISEFWRRWHMSLGFFFMNYLYIPLGGGKKGFIRKLVNLMIVMLLCGLWHGAGWTFVAWGALHGAYLVIHNLFDSAVGTALARLTGVTAQVVRGMSCLVTFVAVVVGWVLFRAESFGSAWVMLQRMFGAGQGKLAGLHVGYSEQLLLVLLPVCWFLPNTYQLLKEYSPAVNVHPRMAALQAPDSLVFRPSLVWSLGISFVFIASVATMLCTGESPYLYFTF